MSSKMKPGSIASEAARLTLELGILVTPDKVKWWRKKKYNLNDTPALRKAIRNQERVAGDRDAFKKLQEEPHQGSEAAPDSDDAADKPPTMADLLISEKAIEEAQGFVPMSEVLDYLRDQWQASEFCNPKLYANKSEAELEKIIRRQTAFDFADLIMLMPSVNRPAWPDWLDSILYPEDAEKPESHGGNSD